jgi:hypothetical protein
VEENAPRDPDHAAELADLDPELHRLALGVELADLNPNSTAWRSGFQRACSGNDDWETMLLTLSCSMLRSHGKHAAGGGAG